MTELEQIAALDARIARIEAALGGAPVNYTAEGEQIVGALIQATAFRTQLRARDIRGKLQHKHICRARFAVIWTARMLSDRSSGELGRIFDRDHSTILNGFRRANALRETDRAFKALTDALLRQFSPEEDPCQA